MGLAKDPHREGPFIIYARVHVFSREKAAAICVGGRNARRGTKREGDLFL